jgi:hypothetical protein
LKHLFGTYFHKSRNLSRKFFFIFIRSIDICIISLNFVAPTIKRTNKTIIKPEYPSGNHYQFNLSVLQSLQHTFLQNFLSSSSRNLCFRSIYDQCKILEAPNDCIVFPPISYILLLCLFVCMYVCMYTYVYGYVR